MKGTGRRACAWITLTLFLAGMVTLPGPVAEQSIGGTSTSCIADPAGCFPQSPAAAPDYGPATESDGRTVEPASRIPQLALLSPSTDGSARLSIPLTLPPGRRGMAPALALVYDSDGSRCVAGRGFDIPVSVIGIDTRMRLPRYDGEDDYAIDGQELIPVSGDS
ncbi:SpvB/TcaC N-terminal domain-containing protein, partial [Salinispira pacifica]